MGWCHSGGVWHWCCWRGSQWIQSILEGFRCFLLTSLMFSVTFSALLLVLLEPAGGCDDRICLHPLLSCSNSATIPLKQCLYVRLWAVALSKYHPSHHLQVTLLVFYRNMMSQKENLEDFDWFPASADMNKYEYMTGVIKTTMTGNTHRC